MNMVVGTRSQQFLKYIRHFPFPANSPSTAYFTVEKTYASGILRRNDIGVRLCFECRRFCSTDYFQSPRESRTLTKLSPQEVDGILRTNEYTHEFRDGSVKSYDSNQLGANSPIEDSRSEASCLLTTGFLVGVFDGHGGGACAQVIAKRLYHYITACLLPHEILLQYVLAFTKHEPVKLIKPYNDKVQFVDDIKDIYTNSFMKFLRDLCETSTKQHFDMNKAIETAFLRLDEDLSTEALPKEDEVLNLKTLSVAMSGTVACVAHIDGPHLHLANVGDSCAVLDECHSGCTLNTNITKPILTTLEAVKVEENKKLIPECDKVTDIEKVRKWFYFLRFPCNSGTLSETNSWVARKLTDEHNFYNQAEVDRIIKEHPYNECGSVIKMDRLLGQLAPLRAMGDFRFKWSKDIMNMIAKHFGEQIIPPNYQTPPYLTACPEVTHYRLTPRDKFLILATDGLWDIITPLQAVRLVGEHMKGKATLNPLKLPKKNMKLNEVNEMLLQRKEGLKIKPKDSNAATHIIRNALGGTEYGIDHMKISRLLTLPDDVIRLFRDDITVTIIYFDSEYLRHCPV